MKDWLAANFLKLNEEKTEVIVFGPNSHLVSERLKDTHLAVAISDKVKSLGFILDSELKRDKQINYVVKSRFFFHLKLLVKTKPFVSPTDFERAISAVVFSRMDYCNSLYAVIDKKSSGTLAKHTKCCSQIH